ncbi:hypothetical protein BXY66_3095 [Shimia isoporae]|uniref:Imelysin-like domain-containing protein n=1 Tax=Shimia isoporae TaxID=647720 RepID=A0A4R1N404_9RHOB|nr:imelysin family protein [Shimia isoporae]TCL00453.1 hypothetical protein BXY66_3095 [Shimia isoporae]
MARILALLGFLILGIAAQAEAQSIDIEERVEVAVSQHVVPGFARFASTAGALSKAAEHTCDPKSETLRNAFHTAFDDWVRISHLRFGPSEVENRAYGVAFWPDTRGKTPKALSGLITGESPAGLSAEDLMQQSIAVQGFYALEYLLFDEAFWDMGEASYRCSLIRNLAEGIAFRAEAIYADWTDVFAAEMLRPSATGTYRSSKEAAGELVKAVSTGLQFTDEARLARPLGTFDRPRPKRAEAWRSERSLRHVILSLEAVGDLATLLAGETSAAERIASEFDTALANANFDDPVFAGVSESIGRLKIENLQQYVYGLRETAVSELVAVLDVSIGFNALDGD